MDIRSFFSPTASRKTSKTPEKESAKLDVKGKSEQNSKNGKSAKESKTDKTRGAGKNSNKKESTAKGTIDKVERSKKREIIKIDVEDDEVEDVNGNKKPLSVKPVTKTVKEEKKPAVSDTAGDNIKKKRKRQFSSDDHDDDADETPVKGQRKKSGKKSQVIESDSDEEPIPKKKEKYRDKKKGGVVFDEESDDEQKPKMSTLDSFLKSPSPRKNVPKMDQKKIEKRTPVNVSDFFGSGSVHRSERKTAVTKRKLEDEEIHDDDDFERTLEQLDSVQKSKKPRLPSEPSPKKSTNKINSTDNLSSKLAAKAKHFMGDAAEKVKEEAKTLVPDTPEPKQVSKKTSPVKVSRKKITSPEKNVSPKKTSPFKSERAYTPKVSPGRPNSGKSTSKTSPSESASSKTSPDIPKLESKSSYRSYLNREGPRSLGAKEVPEGQENCLEGLTFVVTGVLESFDRDEVKHMVEKYGGKVTGSVSKKTNYLVAGRDSGESKLQKAKGFGTKILDEDGLLDLIRTKPGKKSKYEIQAEESFAKEKQQKPKMTSKLSEFERKPSSSSTSASTTISPSKSSQSDDLPKIKSDQSGEVLMWVDKYKPSNMKQVIGQQGDKSNAKKLLHWLTNWHKNQAAGVKPQGKFFGKDDGAGLKAALLSGPPGIGKTTTATLVCKEAGFSFVELNASDTRSKKSLQQEVAQALGNETLMDFMGTDKTKSHGQKHCLLMDEVDGMAGNEDRGGLQELVQLIKGTRIPVICMCNDRNHQKMRTLSNYCFDLRFQRPRVEQIKAAMMSIAYKEGLKIPPPALNEIILAANHDVRQVIHNLSMWTAGEKSLTYDQAKADSNKAKKDMKLGPFDVCRKVFVGGEETAGMSLIDKSNLFFHDYSFGPLFVQENYINVVPYGAKGNSGRHLSLLARTAESLCDGDVVDRAIRSRMAWGLLPTQAFFSSVIPGELMRGSFPQMVSFPSWLGQNSSRNKTERVLQEIRTHMRLQTSGDKRSLNMDYLPYLRHSLTRPMVLHENEGVANVIQLMDDYDIVKEDFDNILEISKWPNSDDPFKNLSAKTKAAFTRTYNKEVHLTPYSTGALTKKKRGGAAALAVEDEEDGGAAVSEESDDNKDDVDNDTMIKVKKKTASSKEKGKAESSGTGKGKGKGGGKGKGAKKGS